MATYTPTRLLVPVQLPTSEVTATPGLLAAAVPASTTWIVKQIVLCNTTGSAVTVSLSVVPSGGTGGAANRIVGGLSLAANETRIFDLALVMVTGDFITGVAGTTTAVTCHIHGLVIV
jgi:hypothetical protein